MREIKLRAWDIEKKKMFAVHEYMPSQPPAFIGAVGDENLEQRQHLRRCKQILKY